MASSKKASGASKKDVKLDEAIGELELVVEKLEKPELALEESIELFEKGTELSDLCFQKLKAAEKKVELLLKKVPNPSSREDFELEEFDPDE